MSIDRPTVLVVDDVADNIHLIQECLETDYELLAATSGEKALEIANSQAIDAVLLDVMMPGMDGFMVCQRLKEMDNTANIPIVFQTALDSSKDIVHGLELGAYFYLTKPIDTAMLKAVVETATQHSAAYRELQDKSSRLSDSLELLEEGSFRFRSVEQVHGLALLVATICPNPESAVLGLTELMLNAVEHGNLGITYDEKSALNRAGEWRNEVDRRLALAENQHKYATLHMLHDEEAFHFTITDRGAGFAWEDYLEIDLARAFDSHGRGIAMANGLSFDRVEYRGRGNEVVASIFRRPDK